MSAEFMRRYDDYTSLRVVRRVDGLEGFIDKARALSDEILGKELTGTIAVDGRDDYLNAGFPYGKVQDASDLVLSLFETYTLPEQKSSGAYYRAKGRLLKGYKPAIKHAQSNVARPPLAEELEMVALTGDLLLDKNPLIEFDSVAPLYHPGVKNGSYEIALLPNIATEVGRLVLSQSKHTHSRISSEGSRLAFPVGPIVPNVMFASVRNMPVEDLAREAHFTNAIRKLLPVSGLLGQVDVK